MLRKLALEGVGPRGHIQLDKVARRLNLITGDNGLGKSFLLEAAWWGLTRTWNGTPAVPHAPEARILHHFDTETGGISRSPSTWDPQGQYWIRKTGRPPNPGLVMYARVDGSFSVWDPVRNYRLYTRRAGGEAESPSAYQFDAQQVLWGLKRPIQIGGQWQEETLCLGLIDEWREWQRADDPRFGLLTRLLDALGPDGLPLRPGALRQPTPDDARAIPTITMPYGEDVPITYAPAGVRRMCKLAYLLAWVLSAHEREAERLGQEPSRQVIVMVDELETHLHPRWQRTVLTSLMEALEGWRPASPPEVQLLVTTHSPLILASVEPRFDTTRDALWKLDLNEQTRQVEVTKDVWHRRGDVGDWLTSDVFDLGMSRSVEGERAMRLATAEARRPDPDPERIQEITDGLRRVLSETDRYWRRWAAFAARHGVDV